MGSSAKRKKEKKKDFQKPKLKVGKSKPKAANFTDTSFKAKSIVLTQQSLSTTAPSSASQFSHHLSMLAHKSDTQRRESLAYLTSAILNTPPGAQLPQPVAVILPEVQRLVLDGSNSVRLQLLKLLQSLPRADIASHADQILLYTRAGMTHLAGDIRLSSLDVLEWLLQVAADEVVGCAGGWVKTLKCFLSLLSWQTDASGKWSSSKATLGKTGGESKIVVKQMNAFASFIRAGLSNPSEGTEISDAISSSFPLWHLEQHTLPERPNAFGRLNLFGAPRDEETEMYEDREDRQRIFREKAEVAVMAGLEHAKKGGGEMGRAAAQLRKAIVGGMVDFCGEEVGNK
ncbi:rRNA processing protein Ipi1 [Glonium stellatum]|uniref:Pre-rRNA-processing protein n=1 Tax=Glonium stellatum TaxID=574774 RepID=A0A8E2ET72_9PEZI|nr:rRNA processing protein Ipi1 [Glonium stellatum]